MSDTETRVRDAFARQARYCRELDAPFTGLLCAALGERLSPDTRLGARVLAWPGNPDLLHDALPLRLAAGLHALALSGTDAAWSALYPPAPLPAPRDLAARLDDVLARCEDRLLPWLDLPPQTNEVGRSAVLMSGLLFLAARTPLPFALYEIGSSGGLNLALDRYAYTLGGTAAGTPGSPVHLAPAWTGPSPAPAGVAIAARRGVDQSPIDVHGAAGRARLLAYIWADQLERLARTRHAVEIAAADPPPIDTMDAAAWVERTIALEPVPGVHRVLMHSVMFQYLSEDRKRRIAAHADEVGARAAPGAPFTWLRMEQIDSGRSGLTATSWPGGKERLLAIAHPHGAFIDWLEGGART